MLIARYVASKRGQSIVEFTLAAPLFFVAIYAIVEFSHLFYVRSTLQHALDEAARYMSTGQGQSTTDPDARLTEIRNRFCTNLVATGVGCPPLTMLQCPTMASDIDPDALRRGGSAAKCVMITAAANRQFFSGFLGWLAPSGVVMNVTTIYQNEPYITKDLSGS